ncbi:hypothetical protein NST41_09550 [Paenibacillus sp. FSL L8-0696]|uniref:hypothetical protein n=1 Tax=Paenibacillus sp. FSL L8-0696 TaxID=2954524 RepID=UPI003119AFE2
MSSNTPNLNLLKVNPVTDGNDTFNIDTMLNDNWDKIDTTVGNKVDKVSGKQLSTNDYTTAEKTKLSGVATGANNYTHPTGDGNQHVPATGTSNNGKVLKAGTTAGSLSWGNVNGSEVVEDATHRFATDTEKVTWNAKETTTGSQAKADAAVLPINNRLNTESLTSINLVAGQQILNATKNARLQGLKVQGRTLIDLLGGAGSGESLTGWNVSNAAAMLSTTQKRSGTSSFKFAPTVSAGCYAWRDFSTPLDTAKQYIVGAWVYIEAFTAGDQKIAILDVNTFTVKYATQAISTTIGGWQFVYVKIPVGNILVGTGYRLLIGAAGTGANVAYIDDVRLYAVSATDYAAIGNTITGEAIDRLLPYVPPGINGVDGLWVRRYGKNLLAGDVSISTGSTVKVVGPYSFDLTTTVTNGNAYIIADVLPNTNYTFSSVLETNALLAVFDETGTSSLTGYGATARTFNSGANTKVRLYFRNDGAASTKRYSNWQLEIGSTGTAFQPREDSLIAFGGVELHANPTDGSEPDILREVNGRYEVTKLWRKIALDGSWAWYWTGNAKTGYKELGLSIATLGTLPNSAQYYAIKYNGQPLKSAAYAGLTAADSVGSGTAAVVITVATADSGWGDSYTPSVDEIKAYFNGWKMALSGSTNPYNGTGTKVWGYQSNLYEGNTNTVPTTAVPNWTPYQLLYRLASVTTETVQEDGSLSLLEGDNFIEVGSGYVSRERVTPSTDTGNWYINNDPSLYSPGGDSRLKNKAREILNVFKDSRVGAWIIEKAATAGYGNSRANQPPAMYDPSASYSVSYIKLDKSPVPGVTGFYAASEKGQLHDLTDGVTEALARVSVVEAKKAEKDAPSLIYPTLLNSWTSLTNETVAYRMINGLVFITGRITGGALTSGTLLFRLPVGYRPLTPLTFTAAVSAGSALTIGEVIIGTDGSVLLYVSGNVYVDLVLPPFVAEK